LALRRLLGELLPGVLLSGDNDDDEIPFFLPLIFFLCFEPEVRGLGISDPGSGLSSRAANPPVVSHGAEVAPCSTILLAAA
jgi:hypothetical protein